MREALAASSGKRNRPHIPTAVFDHARNELVRALVSDDVPENLIAVRGVVQLTPKAARELRKKLVDVLKGLRTREKTSRGKRRRYALTIALVPTEESA